MFKNILGTSWRVSPGAQTPPSNAGGTSSILGLGTKIPHAVWYGKKKKKIFLNQKILLWGCIDKVYGSKSDAFIYILLLWISPSLDFASCYRQVCHLLWEEKRD